MYITSATLGIVGSKYRSNAIWMEYRGGGAAFQIDLGVKGVLHILIGNMSSLGASRTVVVWCTSLFMTASPCKSTKRQV